MKYDPTLYDVVSRLVSTDVLLRYAATLRAKGVRLASITIESSHPPMPGLVVNLPDGQCSVVMRRKPVNHALNLADDIDDKPKP